MFCWVCEKDKDSIARAIPKEDGKVECICWDCMGKFDKIKAAKERDKLRENKKDE